MWVSFRASRPAASAQLRRVAAIRLVTESVNPRLEPGGLGLGFLRQGRDLAGDVEGKRTIRKVAPAARPLTQLLDLPLTSAIHGPLRSANIRKPCEPNLTRFVTRGINGEASSQLDHR